MTDERRACPRSPFFARVVLTTDDGAPPREARSFDLGLGGVGLTCPSPLDIGRAVVAAFHLAGPGGRGVVEAVPGQVVDVRADESGTILGVRFLAPLDRGASPELTRRLDAP